MSEGFFSRAFHMYVDGFRSMTVGRRLWAIIIIKLVILFAIFRMFFFPDSAAAVRHALSQPAPASHPAENN